MVRNAMHTAYPRQMSDRDETSRGIAAVIYGEGVVTNLEFHKNGRHLVMTTNESSIHLIDSLAGKETKKLYAKFSGIGKLQYTHNESCILLTSQQPKKNNDIKYLCMYDNRHLRAFQGHGSDFITSLSMSPIDDNFISCSNRTVNLWNLSSPNPLAILQLPPQMEDVCVSYDGSGVIFGVMATDAATKSHHIRLYDARNYEKGPFEDLAPSNMLLHHVFAKKMQSQFNAISITQRMIQCQWTGFEFSSDGLHILVNTNTDAVLVLDGFKKEVEPMVVLRKNESGMTLGTCFSTAATEILTANEDNEIVVFNKARCDVMETWTGHAGPPACLKCNPMYDIVASACSNTILWLPI